MLSDTYNSVKKQFAIALAFLLCSVAAYARPQASANPAVTTKLPESQRALFHEDWNSISLETSHLVPIVPVLGQKDVGEKFTRELYQVAWRPGDPLDLYLIRPKDVANPPVIVFLYGFPAGTERFKDDHWCAGVTSGGYAAIGFVSALTGQRRETRPPKQWFVSELQESLATTTHDVQMILNFLKDLGGFDLSRVAMFGEGSGGAVAILAAAADPRIKVIEVLNPWGDWPNFLAQSPLILDEHRAGFVKPEFLAKVADLEPVQWLPKVHAQSIRVQNVQAYPEVPEISQKKIEDAAPERAEIDQFGDGNAMILMMMSGGRVFSWLKNALDPAAQTATASEKSERMHFYPAPRAPAIPGSPSSGAVPVVQPESKPSAAVTSPPAQHP